LIFFAIDNISLIQIEYLFATSLLPTDGSLLFRNRIKEIHAHHRTADQIDPTATKEDLNQGYVEAEPEAL